jgi:hypothetical protein
VSAPDPIEPLSPITVPPSSTRTQAIGAVMYLVAAFLFALNGSVAKAQIEAGLSAAQVTEIRTLGCAVLLLIFLAITKPASLRVRRSEIPFLLLFGVLAYAMTPHCLPSSHRSSSPCGFASSRRSRWARAFGWRSCSSSAACCWSLRCGRG